MAGELRDPTLRCYFGRMEKKMETIIWSLGFRGFGFRVGFGFSLASYRLADCA